MKHIHPFPARMAPEIALSKLSSLKSGQKVLDPMSGSGMVLSTAARAGIESIGVDLDPLAVLISGVASTKVDIDDIYQDLELLLSTLSDFPEEQVILPWIDADAETKDFIDFWFDEKQIKQLRLLSYFLVANPIPFKKEVRNAILAAISRLIITKEPKASLARDTAHSRPHKVISQNNYDIIKSLPKSVDHVVSAITASEILKSSKTFLGDARNLNFINSGDIDVIVTSPPYLNALDYMRGHKLSLVWLGYSIYSLRNIRSYSIGAEKTSKTFLNNDFINMLKELDLWENVSATTLMLQKYFIDLCNHLTESYRVLKAKGVASYVIGNSEIKGHYIPNNEFLKKAAYRAGFDFISEEMREIPNNRRYLPISGDHIKALSKRMRTEYIVTFSKSLK
jgi:Predicted DNA modification methylase